MTFYITTSDAVAEYYKADAEWCRLSNLFHRIDRHDTPRLKDRARQKLLKREAQLAAEVTWAAASNDLPLVLMTENHCLQVPGHYLQSPRLGDAIRTSSAVPLNLPRGYSEWNKARLAFDEQQWHRWAAGLPIVAADAKVQLGIAPAVDGGVANGGGNRAYRDEALVAEVVKDVQDGRAKSFRQAANERSERIPGAGTPESKTKRIAAKAAKAAKASKGR